MAFDFAIQRQLKKTVLSIGLTIKEQMQQKKRENSGYLIFPHLQPPEQNEGESHVLETLNYLLKEAMKICLPEFPLDGLRWTTIRYTVFRLTLEEVPFLGIPAEINAFADNGHTITQN